MDIQLTLRSESDSEFFVELFGEIKNSELPLNTCTENVRHQILLMQYHSFEQCISAKYPERMDYLITYCSKKAGRLLLHKDENNIRIINISLINEFRNFGIGSAILHNIIEEANKLLKSVHLEVDKINPAINLYSRLGFKIVQEDELKYSMKYNCREAIIL